MEIKGVGRGSAPREPEPKRVSAELKKSKADVSEVAQKAVVSTGRAKIKHPTIGPINSTARKVNKFAQS